MMSTFYSTLIAILAMAIGLAMGNQVNAGLNSAIDSNIHFGRNLYQVVGNTSNNLVMSPLSAQLALAMTRAGARGTTAQQISTALHIQQGDTQPNFAQLLELLQNQNDTVVRIANRAYAAKDVTLHPDFLRTIRDTLHADALNIDFNTPTSAANVINRWIEEVTEDKIKNMVNSGFLGRDTSVLIVNALYFKGAWDERFQSVGSRPFHISTNRIVDTPFLLKSIGFSDDVRLAELPDLSARLLDVPYKGGNFRFVIVLPNEGTTLDSLERSVSTRDIGALQQLANHEWQMLVFIPEITLDISIDLSGPFKELGMTAMFSSSEADLSGMTSGGPRLFVSNVLQKTYLKLDKKGTEAAAATLIRPEPASARGDTPKPFDANRPFLFYLVHRTTDHRSTVLFSGKFVSP